MKQPRGFTLIELSMALAVLVIVSGLVIVRAGGWGPRQRAISAARTIGNTLSHYRELARNEERLYAYVLDGDAGRISIYAPVERQGSSLTSSVLVRSVELPAGFEFEFQGLNANKIQVVYLDRNGVIAQFRLVVRQGDHSISVNADPILNLVTYDEK